MVMSDNWLMIWMLCANEKTKTLVMAVMGAAKAMTRSAMRILLLFSVVRKRALKRENPSKAKPIIHPKNSRSSQTGT